MAVEIVHRRVYEGSNRKYGRRNVTLTIDGAEPRTIDGITYTPHTVTIILRHRADGSLELLAGKTNLMGYTKGRRLIKEYIKVGFAPPPKWLAPMVAAEETRP